MTSYSSEPAPLVKKRDTLKTAISCALSLALLAGGIPPASAEAGARQEGGAEVQAAPPAPAADASAAAEKQSAPAAPEAVAAPPAAGTTAGTATQTAESPKAPRIIWRPGQSLEFGAGSDDLVPTDDVELARKQVAAYPDNPEASFILAVALTRTSRVEEALAEVRRARKLAEPKGGPAYFDKMIATYEEMLKWHPKENRVRYGLAWAYYMKAYLLARLSRNIAKARAAAQGLQPADPPKPPNFWETASLAAQGQMPANPPKIQGALEQADPSIAPQIKRYYELALGKLDELLAQKPDDIWARVYRAFLDAEYTGNLEAAIKTWKECQAKAPDNPAPYFFLGEAYLKQGNLKECFNNISKAIALRASGK